MCQALYAKKTHKVPDLVARAGQDDREWKAMRFNVRDREPYKAPEKAPEKGRLNGYLAPDQGERGEEGDGDEDDVLVCWEGSGRRNSLQRPGGREDVWGKTGGRRWGLGANGQSLIRLN